MPSDHLFPPAARPIPGNQPTPRGNDGRFTGAGAITLAAAPLPTTFTPADLADAQLQAILQEAAAHLATAPDAGQPPPVFVLKASPGAGKSREWRALLSQMEDADLPGDRVCYAPTLALVDEAVAHSRSLGADAIAFRGRSATDPATGAPMCAKADIARRVASLGLRVAETLCRREAADGTFLLCPFYDSCAYQAQPRALPEGPVQRHAATAFLTLPDPTGRDIGLITVDETFLGQLARSCDIAVDHFLLPRAGLRQPRRDPKRTGAVAAHADLLQAARAVVAMLDEGGDLPALGYGADDFRAFAALELKAVERAAGLRPDQDAGVQEAALDRLEASRDSRHRAHRHYRLWTILAEAMEAGRGRTERLRLTGAREQDRRVIRACWRTEVPRKAPLMILDADADPVILAALGLDGPLRRIDLRPNAQVFQLHDRRMSNGTLLNSPGLRGQWINIIRREVLIDRHGPAGGVLVGATRKVVRRFFEDAGHDFTGLDEEEISRRMLETRLHGANWLWFGGRALGSNRYRDCSAAIVIGREEMPVEALEDKARAIFGDGDGPALQFVGPDAQGRILLPETTQPYEMTDGSARGAQVRLHPDPRIRALQAQGRECATRQLVERLRLAHAPYTKRVILGCSLPVAGLPVDRLLAWEELAVYRLDAALAEAALGAGVLRLTAAGISADAPGTFASGEAAKAYFKAPLVSVQADLWPSGMQIPVVPVRVRPARKGARMTEAVVFAACIEEAVVMLEETHGPGVEIEVLPALPPKLTVLIHEIRMPVTAATDKRAIAA